MLHIATMHGATFAVTTLADGGPVAQPVVSLDTASLISLAIGTVLPLLVGLVTTRATNATIKALLLLALSGVSAFLTALLAAVQAHTAFDWRGALLTLAVTYVVGVATHVGLWKPSGAAGKAQDAGVASGHVQALGDDPGGGT